MTTMMVERTRHRATWRCALAALALLFLPASTWATADAVNTIAHIRTVEAGVEIEVHSPRPFQGVPRRGPGALVAQDGLGKPIQVRADRAGAHVARTVRRALGTVSGGG